MNRLVEIVFVSSIFLSLNSIPLGFVDFYYYYIIVLLAFPLLFVMYRQADQWILLSFGYLLIVGLLHVILGNNGLSQFVKVYVGAFVFYLLYYFIIK